MTYGIYHPMYTVTYRAALDANKNAIVFHPGCPSPNVDYFEIYNDEGTPTLATSLC